MKKVLIIILLIVVLVGLVSIIYIYYNLKKNTSDSSLKCEDICRANGYRGGSCVEWSDSNSPENTCYSLSSTLISGKISDCKTENPKGVIGAGGLICCCK
jgi:hypothetical protein